MKKKELLADMGHMDISVRQETLTNVQGQPVLVTELGISQDTRGITSDANSPPSFNPSNGSDSAQNAGSLH